MRLSSLLEMLFDDFVVHVAVAVTEALFPNFTDANYLLLLAMILLQRGHEFIIIVSNSSLTGSSGNSDEILQEEEEGEDKESLNVVQYVHSYI